MIRLQKYISECGIASRRKAEELIKSGEVKVNGEIITELGTKVLYEDKIEVSGKKITLEPKYYYLLNKPRGYISSTKDEFGRKTVCELINSKVKIFPIGRLDYDTTGILLLTNDGVLSDILTHPKNEVSKTYLAKLDRILSIEDLYKIKNGLMIDNKKIVPKKVKLKKELNGSSYVEIEVCEGLNHLIKKIFENVGYDVIKLKRIKYAFLNLEGLDSGYYRELNSEEVERLYALKKRSL